MANLQRVFNELEKEKKQAQKELERLEEAVSAIGKLIGKTGRGAAAQTEETVRRVRRKLWAAARKRISQAQKARWAKLRRG